MLPPRSLLLLVAQLLLVVCVSARPPQDGQDVTDTQAKRMQDLKYVLEQLNPTRFLGQALNGQLALDQNEAPLLPGKAPKRALLRKRQNGTDVSSVDSTPTPAPDPATTTTPPGTTAEPPPSSTTAAPPTSSQGETGGASSSPPSSGLPPSSSPPSSPGQTDTSPGTSSSNSPPPPSSPSSGTGSANSDVPTTPPAPTTPSPPAPPTQQPGPTQEPGPTQAPPPTTQAPPPAGDSTTPVPPVVLPPSDNPSSGGSGNTGGGNAPTGGAPAQPPSSIDVPITTTDGQGNTVVSSTRAPAPPSGTAAGPGVTAAPDAPASFAGEINIVTTDQDGEPITLSSVSFGEVLTTTGRNGRTFVTTFTPAGGRVSSIVLQTTTLPNGERSTITSYAPVAQATNGSPSRGGTASSPDASLVSSGAAVPTMIADGRLAAVAGGLIGLAQLL